MRHSSLLNFLVGSSIHLQLIAAADTSGCGIERDFAGQTHTGKSIESSGGTRTYDVYLPPNYDENTQTPLIISYHGNHGTSEKQRALDRLDNTTWNNDHITVWPNGVNKSWEGPSYAVAGVSDKVFTTDLIAHLRTQFCIDSSRIYAVGKSNGGGFVGTLACSPGHGDDFAAFAACSGAFYTDVVEDEDDGCSPARSPLPIMEFHGSNDGTIPYQPTDDGSGGPLPQIPDWLAAWGQRNGCPSDYKPQVSTLQGHDDTQQTLYQVNGTDVVTGYLISGMDHDWPSTTPNSDSEAHGDGPVSIDATPMILDFFRKNQKP
ncbi:uncharacterized protein TRUGW13939_10960 [Talaromyces rugulosus]|uniref:feruloyl esterase n=1 Tax=Talaromyces rugulosus TaxID=121627 RepID=A0A7H8RBF0_TALRU|nr:uncharacterized protein TRUGW13939_10960 [Talaromyces rugulosus]QKX63789.1 hypothetical protein TRUGW13939_10960 [Talaromyces rugulosus]